MIIEDYSKGVVIVAGGKGLRAGGDVPKQFQLVAGVPILMRTVTAFYHFDNNIDIIVVLPEGFDTYWKELCLQHNFNINHKLAIGGESRFHSVRNGLLLVDDAIDIVGIHDAARPFVRKEVIKRCYDEANVFQCGIIPVVHETNSVRVMEGYESKPFDRSKLRIVQTPQVFPTSSLKNAYDAPYSKMFTDDASVADAAGVQVKLVEGDESNIKITTPFDIKLAEFIFSDFIL